ncbi:MAG TPA: hypothetical protein VKX16_08190 [Chloroflexota bacterium]|nr:hypothetical protein [Chloroflexota bacterium]
MKSNGENRLEQRLSHRYRFVFWFASAFFLLAALTVSSLVGDPQGFYGWYALFLAIGSLLLGFLAVPSALDRLYKGVIYVSLASLAAIPFGFGLYQLAGGGDITSGNDTLVGWIAFLIMVGGLFWFPFMVVFTLMLYIDRHDSSGSMRGGRPSSRPLS